ncbi:Hypothetical predicted protein [Octopus vulgaris]|uniref:Uncharacterized protein n=1 Tax=Octopus vulgaris TaxID=6645 RepID=A0AA36BP80_OCTVU|nr:Hypothetical predicted protein [Octopus vulgaris]
MNTEDNYTNWKNQRKNGKVEKRNRMEETKAKSKNTEGRHFVRLDILRFHFSMKRGSDLQEEQILHNLWS